MPDAQGKKPAQGASACETAPRGETACLRGSPARAGGSTRLACAVAVYLAFQVYAPALGGPFVFDDTYQPYHTPDFSNHLGALDPRRAAIAHAQLLA